MKIKRREFIGTAGCLAAAGLLGTSAGASESADAVKVGICDWNIVSNKYPDADNKANPDLIPEAKEAGVDGIQVSVGYPKGNDTIIPLRNPEVRKKFIEMGKEHGIVFHSVAAGTICNSIPLAYEPESAIYVVDAIEAAAALGAKNILIAFFGNGDLRLRDSLDRMRDISDGPFKIWELDSIAVAKVVRVLKQIAPRAEDLGVALGLENTLSAEQNLEIIERAGSDIVQVYYDIANSTTNGYDVPNEIRMLGNKRICEIHLKDNGKDVTRFDMPNAEIDWTKIGKACKDIGYDKWYCLEESGRPRRFTEDTNFNVAFAKKALA